MNQDFGIEGSIVDPNFLRKRQVPGTSKSVHDELALRLPLMRQDRAAAERFLEGTAEIAQMVSEDPAWMGAGTAAGNREAMQRARDAALAMRAALDQVGQAPALFSLLEAWLPVALNRAGGEPERADAAALCGRLAQDLAQFAAAADVAGEALAGVRRTDKPAAQRARFFVTLVAECYSRTAGELPPYSKYAWFVEFIELAGQAVGLECKAATVESAITSMRK